MATRSMSDEHALQIAFKVISILKAALPQHMPRMEDEHQTKIVATVYADVIARTHLPARVFQEAALWITRTHDGDRQITPALFRQAVWRANEELSADPDYRQVREQIRQKREQQRHLQMGLTADGRSPELCQRAGNVDQKAVEATKKRLTRKWVLEAGKSARDGNQQESDAISDQPTIKE